MALPPRVPAMSDRIFSLAWLGVCALIIYQMWGLSVPFAYEPVGPKAFPILLAILMAICCLLMIISPDPDVRWPAAAFLGKGAVLLGTLFAFGYFFEILGYPLAAAAMSVVVARMFGGSWLSTILTAVAIGVLGYLIFDRVLEVTLPLGQVWR